MSSAKRASEKLLLCTFFLNSSPAVVVCVMNSPCNAYYALPTFCTRKEAITETQSSSPSFRCRFITLSLHSVTHTQSFIQNTYTECEVFETKAPFDFLVVLLELTLKGAGCVSTYVRATNLTQKFRGYIRGRIVFM